jgi:hypothetical protein
MEIMFPEEIRWPDRNATVIPIKFLGLAGFPRVGGCVDGSLIPIDAPKDFEAQYVDRHGNHSINGVFVCGPRMELYYVSARWPGSIHDSRVLRNSSLYHSCSEGWIQFPGGVILGDSGYSLLDWLMTPVVRPGPQLGVKRYLRRHISTRRLVENSLGVLKEKFPCLNYLRLIPEFAGIVVLCCYTSCQKEVQSG